MQSERGGVRIGWAALITAAILFAGNPNTAAADTQVRFNVSQPFRVGSHAYDAGVIVLHTVVSYTPSLSLFEVWVNGDCLGMMAARRSPPEGSIARTEAFFRRDDAGVLQMIGFHDSGLTGPASYRFGSL